MVHPEVVWYSENSMHAETECFGTMKVASKFQFYRLQIGTLFKNFLRQELLRSMEYLRESKHVKCVQIVMCRNFEYIFIISI